MAINKLGNRLKQEALKSPKKAGALGVMLLVAIYFWAPQVGKLFSSQEVTNTVPTGTPIIAPTAHTTALEAEQGEGIPWYETIEWMRSDPLQSVPAAFVSGRDPFENLNEPTEVIVNPKVVDKTKELVTPADLGLTLTSTIVSPGRSTASISGKVYRPGAELKKAFKNRTVTVLLREVHSRQVLVEIDGNLFRLQIAKPTSERVRIYQHD